jgi:hypothetical protein
MAAQGASVGAWVKAGGRVLALGLDQVEAKSFLPEKVAIHSGEHIAAWFPPFSADSLLAGVSPADIHNRDPRALPLVKDGATIYGDGVLAVSIQPAPHFWAHFLRGKPAVGQPWRVRYNAALGEIRRSGGRHRRSVS